MRNILITLIFLPLLSFAEANAVVYNVTHDRVISGSLSEKEVSIASISKLMTIYTVLKSNQDMNEKLTVIGNKINHTKLNKGMVLTREELVNMSLVSSDNLAAVTLSQHYPGGQEQFIRQMNAHTKELGMMHTGFVEPTGLSPMNYSSVSDIVALTRAVSVYPIVQRAAQTQQVVTKPAIPDRFKKKGKKSKKIIKQPRQRSLINNPTSHYFGQEGIVTIKTGFTNAAGFCITMLVSANDQLYNITVLGAKSKQEREKIIKKAMDKINNV
jgi:D-alanyl-D-alanine endopeptidase (penicillin-binding protein 7)